MLTEQEDRYIKFTKYLALLLLPASIFAIIFIRIERKLILEGVIHSPRQVTVSSVLAGTIVREKLAKEGDRLSKGDKILTFLDTMSAAENRKIAELHKQRIEHEITIFSNANREDLDKIIKKKQFEDLLLKLKQEELRVDASLHFENNLISRAPFNGELIRFRVEEYDKVEIGTPLYEFAVTENLYLKTYVTEKTYVLIKVGCKAYIKSRIYNYMWYRIFSGSVIYISNFAIKHPETGETVFEVHVNLLDGEEFFRVNTTAICEIVRDQVTLMQYFLNAQ